MSNPPTTERSKGELAFIEQHTRMMLVDWAFEQVSRGELPEHVRHGRPVFFDFALSKGWLSKREPHRLTATGFGVAASFLKR